MTRLVQVALRAEDLPRATAFYTTLLASEPIAAFDPPGLVFFDLQGTRLLIDVNAPASLIYLEFPDLHEALDRIAGIATVVSPPHRIFSHENGVLGPAGREEWQAFITDTEANTVGLVTFI